MGPSDACPHRRFLQAGGVLVAPPPEWLCGRRLCRFPTASSAKCPLTAKTEKSGILIRQAQEKVAYQPRGDHAKGDAVAAVAEREISFWPPGRLPDVGEPVFRLGECPGPGVGWREI